MSKYLGSYLEVHQDPSVAPDFVWLHSIERSVEGECRGSRLVAVRPESARPRLVSSPYSYLIWPRVLKLIVKCTFAAMYQDESAKRVGSIDPTRPPPRQPIWLGVRQPA